MALAEAVTEYGVGEVGLYWFCCPDHANVLAESDSHVKVN